MNNILGAFISVLKTVGDCAVIYLRDLGGALFDLKTLIGIIVCGILLIPKLYKFFNRL